jgi:4-diphosphocytidyl-2-C-methyl-D-erythritol kinase
MNQLPGGSIPVQAPAKINLYFNVIGRRADGYHLVDSLIAFTTLGDTLAIVPGETLDIVCDGPFAAAMPPAQQNLVYRAAEKLAAAAGVAAHATIAITKNLPVASGIGGGSTDAAAALKALAAYWGLSARDADLADIGLSLGADIPVCLRATTAYSGGIGEVLDDAPPLPPVGLLLVNPGIAVPTASVFRAREGGFSTARRLEYAPADTADLAAMLARRGNDLTDPAIRLCPEIRDVLDALAALPGCRLAQMCGSGATCFGLFDSVDSARTAAPLVARPGWWVAPTGLIG